MQCTCKCYYTFRVECTFPKYKNLNININQQKINLTLHYNLYIIIMLTTYVYVYVFNITYAINTKNLYVYDCYLLKYYLP